MSFLEHLPWLAGAAVVASVILLVVGPYVLARRLFLTHATDDTESLASSVIFRVASLHVLILALVFAQEQVNVLDIRQTTAKEAAAIADVFYDLARYDATKNEHLRKTLAEYTEVVIHEEWLLLIDGDLSQEAWDLWSYVYEGILDLTPQNPRDEALRSRMLKDIETISESRNLRRADYSSGVTGLFWVVAISGIVFIVLPYFVFRPRPINILLLTIFATYNGMVIYTISVMSNPYSPPAAVEPLPFVDVFQHDMEALLRPE